MQDGSVNYWFKYGYDSAQAKKAGSDNNDIKNEFTSNGKNNKAKVYKGKSWKANFIDSSLTIDFGNNEFNLPVLSGKYAQLGSGSLYFKQISYIDSSYNGKQAKYTKLVSTIYKHPYVHDFKK